MEYILNKNVQQNGDHEVHSENCKDLPIYENRIYLGNHNSCAFAVDFAKKAYPNININGCYWCATSCHTS